LQLLDQKVSSILIREDFWFGSDEYVISGALHGFFYPVAQEKKKTRQHSMGGNG